MAKRLAVVTGSNKGIGFEIAKKLAAAGFKTIIAARDPERGQDALNAIKAIDSTADVEMRVLDIDNSESIDNFRIGIEQDYGKMDILINNAAMAFKAADPTPFEEQARPTVSTNYFATLELTQKMLPLLRLGESPRLIFIASQAGALRILPSPEKKERVTADDLTIEEISAMAHSFVSDVESGQHKAHGWPNTCYGMSKLLVIALSRVLAKQEAPVVTVNSCCPGWCSTDMSSHKGPRSADKGAEVAEMLATMDVEPLPTGKFFYDCQEIEW